MLLPAPKKSPKALHLFGLLFIYFALFIIAGGPLILLQGVAWANMVREYSKSDTLAHAVQKTWSGKYRCSLCKKIAEANKQEQKVSSLLKAEKMLKAAFSTDDNVKNLFSSREFLHPPENTLEYHNIIQEPPTPYPREQV